MKKVILFNFTGRTGGGPIDACEMAKAMLKNGRSIVAVLSENCCNMEEWKKLPLERLIILPTYRDKITLVKSSLRFLLFGDKRLEGLSGEYEISYIYCPMVSLWSRMINNKIGRKIRVCAVNHDPIPHSGDRAYHLANLFGLQALYRDSDTIVVHSRRFVSYVENRYKKEGKVLYIPLGRQDYIKQIENPAALVHYEEEKVNFLFFGRIEPYKGIGVLLNAYEQALARCPDLSLTIAGSGDCGPYKEQMTRLGVKLINRWIDDEEIGAFFRGENIVLVLPYLDATQSGVVLVALEYGVPSICSDTGGLSEQVKEEETGILVPPGDIQKLSEAMIRTARDPDYRKQLTRGIPEMLNNLNWTRLAAQVDSFMQGTGNGKQREEAE